MIELYEHEKSLVLICLLRYSLGRQSYIVGTTVEVIKRNWPEFSKQEQKQIKREIKEHFLYANDNDYVSKRHWETILEIK